MQQRMINKNRGFYASKVRLFLNEYDGMSLEEFCKAYNIDPYKYLCDVFRRIKKTAKDQLVNLVAHKWQPQMAPAIY